MKVCLFPADQRSTSTPATCRSMIALLFCLFLLSPFGSLRAAEETENLSELLASVRLPDADVCAVTAPGKTIKNIVFVFEGFKGYSDELGVAFRKFESLSPECKQLEDGKNMVFFSNGKMMEYGRLRDQFHGIVQNGGGSPVALKNYILRGLCKSNAMNFSDTEVFYFPESADLNKALSCAERHAKTVYTSSDGQTLYPTLTVLGYSYGGNAALEFAKVLYDANFQIDLGFTTDPVPKNKTDMVSSELDSVKKKLKEKLGIGGATARSANDLDSSSPSNFTPPDRVHWVNYWQESDNRGGGDGTRSSINIGLHGHGVNSADTNVLIVPPHFDSKPNGAHWRIFDNDRVSSSIAAELSRVNIRRSTKKLRWNRD